MNDIVVLEHKSFVKQGRKTVEGRPHYSIIEEDGSEDGKLLANVENASRETVELFAEALRARQQEQA